MSSESQESDEALYTCDSGFTLIGNNRRVCQANGTWSGQEPVCERIGMRNIC